MWNMFKMWVISVIIDKSLKHKEVTQIVWLAVRVTVLEKCLNITNNVFMKVNAMNKIHYITVLFR